MEAKEQHSSIKQSTDHEANNPPSRHSNPQSRLYATKRGCSCSDSSGSMLAGTMSGINQASGEPTGYQKATEKLHAIILC